LETASLLASFQVYFWFYSARARVETHEVRRSTAYGKREVQSARARVETHEVRHGTAYGKRD